MKPKTGLASGPQLKSVLELLNLHHQSFFAAATFAEAVDNPVPSDSRAWSQVLVSMLIGIKGIARKKGADLFDGSDVKAANAWLAIDTPRFNGCLKSGRKGEKGSLETLDKMPHLFLVLWDYAPNAVNHQEGTEKQKRKRCRIWVVRPKQDRIFRAICAKWYQQRDQKKIKSDNFQLHPPLNRDSNVITNTCGNLIYPLLFQADWTGTKYRLIHYNRDVLNSGTCLKADSE